MSLILTDEGNSFQSELYDTLSIVVLVDGDLFVVESPHLRSHVQLEAIYHRVIICPVQK